MPEVLPTDQYPILDQDRIRWPGSGSAVPGKTPNGFYDNDKKFQLDCYNGAKWAAIRLGHPILDVELTDVNFYACFEEAVNEYGSQVNQWNIINNLNNFQGQPLSNWTQSSQGAWGTYVGPSALPYVVELAQGYGSEAGVGGTIDLKRGWIDVKENQQVYDLQSLWGDVIDGGRIEVRKIFHERAPAFARIYDPFSMTGMSYSNVLTEMGFAAYSPAVQFLMTPIFEDLLRGQAIEFNDMVRKSAYSFELVNNKLRLFPIPQSNFKLYFDYFSKKSKSDGMFVTSSVSNPIISDFSNVPYNNPVYSQLNDVARQWIRKYFLALCKEVLGCIRQKVQTLPIPGGELTLDGAELRQEAQQEKEQLVTQLRETLEKTSRTAQIEAKALEAEKVQEILKKVPLLIYVS